MVGTGPSVGTPAGVDATAGTVAGGDVAGRGDGGGGLLGALVGLGALAGMAVTFTVPTALASVAMGGFVAASAAAVSVTDAAPLGGLMIWAWTVNDDGVTSVPSDPRWHETVPSPLGHKPTNDAWPADAASVTDTSGAAPF